MMSDDPKLFNFLLNQDDRHTLRQLAERTTRTQSEVLRMLIRTAASQFDGELEQQEDGDE